MERDDTDRMEAQNRCGRLTERSTRAVKTL